MLDAAKMVSWVLGVTEDAERAEGISGSFGVFRGPSRSIRSLRLACCSLWCKLLRKVDRSFDCANVWETLP